jgi:hypothetical protein
MNISAAHSCKAIRKCLKETKKLPRASYPLGNTSQFRKPVPHKKTKRIKDITLTIQSFEDLSLDIHSPSIAVKRLNHRPRKCLGYQSPHEVFWSTRNGALAT